MGSAERIHKAELRVEGEGFIVCGQKGATEGIGAGEEARWENPGMQGHLLRGWASRTLPAKPVCQVPGLCPGLDPVTQRGGNRSPGREGPDESPSQLGKLGGWGLTESPS